MAIQIKSPARLAWERARAGAKVGAFMGVICVGVGILRAVVAFVLGKRIAMTLGRDVGLLALYVGGFIAAGAVIGALWPLRRRPVGSYILGYLAAGIVSTVCAVIVMHVEHETNWHVFVFIVGIMTLIFGTAAGIQFRED